MMNSQRKMWRLEGLLKKEEHTSEGEKQRLKDQSKQSKNMHQRQEQIKKARKDSKSVRSLQRNQEHSRQNLQIEEYSSLSFKK